MPLQTTHGLTVASGDYKDQLLPELNITEGFNGGLPYIDPKWIATIGYGFNIETVSAYLALTLNQLGILVAGEKGARLLFWRGVWLPVRTSWGTVSFLRMHLYDGRLFGDQGELGVSVQRFDCRLACERRTL
ncbi:MAG: hypothetical protein OEY28_10185 [Nitrospira sp.]|nr:hypothetical protein [Nitrospira sp.]